MFGKVFLSIPEVLDVMLKQSASAAYSTKRQLICNDIELGLLKEMRKDWAAAEQLYLQSIDAIEPTIEQLRKDLQQVTEGKEQQKAAGETLPNDFDDETDGHHKHTDSRATDNHLAAISRLHSWLSLYHRVLFCHASVKLEREEKEVADRHYQKAEEVRKELMSSMEESVIDGIDKLRQLQTKMEVKALFTKRNVIIKEDVITQGGILSDEGIVIKIWGYALHCKRCQTRRKSLRL